MSRAPIVSWPFDRVTDVLPVRGVRLNKIELGVVDEYWVHSWRDVFGPKLQ